MKKSICFTLQEKWHVLMANGIKGQMLTRQCERCESIMREEQLLLASERRYVVVYHCPSCDRNEYGTVVYNKKAIRNSSATHQHFKTTLSSLVK